MDDLTYEGPVIIRTLKELEIINTWLGGNAVTIHALNQLLARKTIIPGQTLHIADLGCGGGDMLKIVSKWAKKKGIKTRLTGYDANPYIIEFARKHADSYPEIEFKALDVLSEAFNEETFDIVLCTLFCHHFEDEVLNRLLSRLKSQTRLAIVINDIHRHWFAYHSIKWLTGIFSRSEMVKYDAKLSVLRAFRRKELKNIIHNSGFSSFEIRWKWAFRFQAILWV